jgi:hypothetical protein
MKKREKLSLPSASKHITFSGERYGRKGGCGEKSLSNDERASN